MAKEKFLKEKLFPSDSSNADNFKAAAEAKMEANVKKNNKTKAKTTEAIVTRKSKRLEEKPGPAPSYKESEDYSMDGDGEASSHVSRRDGRSKAVPGAR